MDIKATDADFRVSFDSFPDFDGSWNHNDINQLYTKATSLPEFKAWNTEQYNYNEVGYKIFIGFDWISLTFLK